MFFPSFVSSLCFGFLAFIFQNCLFGFPVAPITKLPFSPGRGFLLVQQACWSFKRTGFFFLFFGCFLGEWGQRADFRKEIDRQGVFGYPFRNFVRAEE